jgi:hypothetical protein
MIIVGCSSVVIDKLTADQIVDNIGGSIAESTGETSDLPEVSATFW